jgi:hypothetical protein
LLWSSLTLITPGAGLDNDKAASKEIDRDGLLGERWKDDRSSNICQCCHQPIKSGFILSGKHHCRCCGNIICGDCSLKKIVLPNLGFNEPVRVCNTCYSQKQQAKSSSVHILQQSAGLGGGENKGAASSGQSNGISTIDPSTSLERIRHLRTRQIHLSDICAVYGRRHLLRKSALELMTIAPRKGYLFNFPGGTKKVKEFFYRLMSMKPSRLYQHELNSGDHLKDDDGIREDNNNEVVVQDPYTKWPTVSRPEVLLRALRWTEKWQNREISNFEYLMHLNTIAGRTYNDLTQYPIFPWILSNYDSDTLDLNDPTSYRDLSKPIGALNEGRLIELQERYNLWEDPTGQGIPPFLYGTHYSNVGSVLFFLSRIEPYTAHMVDLQSGALDQVSI